MPGELIHDSATLAPLIKEDIDRVVTIADGASVGISGVSRKQNAIFAGATGTLKLDHWVVFGGRLVV